MPHVIEARVPARTHTGKRNWADTETPIPPQDRWQDNPPPAADLVLFESESSLHSIVWSGKGESTVPASDDQENAILQTPGTQLSSRLREVLALVASCGPLADTSLAELVERLLSRDIPVHPHYLRHSVSIQGELSADEWMAQVRAWASSFPQTNHFVDDSRESIYGDRG